jgi:hypothetical protein
MARTRWDGEKFVLLSARKNGKPKLTFYETNKEAIDLARHRYGSILEPLMDEQGVAEAERLFAYAYFGYKCMAKHVVQAM